jgi:hypothetical protein
MKKRNGSQLACSAISSANWGKVLTARSYAVQAIRPAA